MTEENKEQNEPQRPRTGPRRYRGVGELWDLKDRYMAWMSASGFSINTAKAKNSDLTRFFKYLEKNGIDRVADVTSVILEEYALHIREPKNGLPPAIRYVSHQTISLRLFFKWLAEDGAILYDPAVDLEAPRIAQELPHEILTQAETRAFLNAPDLGSPVGYRDRALIELIYSSGLRSAEAISLKVGDIAVKECTIWLRQGKGNKDRAVPIPALSMRYVQEYIEKVRPAFAARRKHDDGTLWLAFTGGKFDKNRLGSVFARTRKLAGLSKHVTPMTLRHTLCSTLLENGMDIRCIQEMMAHSKLSTTQIYTSVSLSGLKKWFAKCHPRERRRPHDGDVGLGPVGAVLV